MTVPVLIVTPSLGFGELIRQTLEEAGGYQVTLVTRGKEALDHAQSGAFVLGILDADLVDNSLIDLCRGLKACCPSLRLVIIPPDNGLSDEEIAELSPQGFLNKPFYLPSLLSTIEEVLADLRIEQGVEQEADNPVPPRKVASEVDPAPPWLADVDRAAQYLTRLTLESAAQAALITRGEQIWAYSGELPQYAVQELATAVSDYWAHDGGSDLARFVRLEATGGEYLLYATALVGDMVLSLAYDATTPFSKIRAQAGSLAHALSTEPNNISPSDENTTGVTSGLAQADESAAVTPEPHPFEEEIFEMPSPLFLDDVPPAGSIDWEPEEKFRQNQLPPATDSPRNHETEISLEDQPQPGIGPSETVAAEKRGHPIRGPAPESPLPDIPLPDINNLAWEREYPVFSQVENTMPAMRDYLPSSNINQVVPVMHHLSYSCVLVPRMPGHHLTGDLAAQLTEWLPQLCLAFGWRLDHLAIRPDYLQWVVNVSPDISPGSLVDIIRTETSQRVFAEFPKLAELNPSGDYWAPGYLLVGDSQPITGQIIKTFIDKTRSWQGASGRE